MTNTLTITLNVGHVLMSGDETFGVDEIQDIISTATFASPEDAEGWLKEHHGDYIEVGDGWYLPAEAVASRTTPETGILKAAWIEE